MNTKMATMTAISNVFVLYNGIHTISRIFNVWESGTQKNEVKFCWFQRNKKMKSAACWFQRNKKMKSAACWFQRNKKTWLKVDGRQTERGFLHMSASYFSINKDIGDFLPCTASIDRKAVKSRNTTFLSGVPGWTQHQDWAKFRKIQRSHRGTPLSGFLEGNSSGLKVVTKWPYVWALTRDFHMFQETTITKHSTPQQHRQQRRQWDSDRTTIPIKLVTTTLAVAAD